MTRAEPQPAADVTAAPAPRATSVLARLRRGDRAAIRLWLLTRVATFLVVGSAGWVLTDRDISHPAAFLKTVDQWDFRHFATIGRFGYAGDPATGPVVPLEAFFPGYPLVLRAVHTVVGNWAVSGLLISFVCGGIAVVVLSRIAGLDHPPRVGERAVLLLLLAPSAVFLAVGYTEPLFLAFALPAWLYARRGNWPAAGILAAGATATRINGVFLLCALVVEFFVGRPGVPRRLRDLPWLAVGTLPVLAYMCFLYRRTGDWTAWDAAQAVGWGRHVVEPLTALRNTWHDAFTTGGGTIPGVVWMNRWEILAVALGVVLTAWLLHRRRWAEGVYVGLTTASLATSTLYMSVPRATLLWWPLWIVLAELTLRRRGAFTGYLVLIAPFSVVFALLFGGGRWAG